MTSVTETAPLGGSDRVERIRRIADECLKQWAVGETFSETELIEANPDLQPELGVALRRIRQIAQAEQDGSGDNPTPRSPEETVVHEGFVPSSGCMHIRCPHCHNPVELLVDSPLTDITCSTCGSAFSLISSDTQTCQAPPLQTLGHFELVSRLGMGGFGTVWKAHDLELDRTVAVKIPRRGQLDPIGEEQFLREARVAAQLRHTNIVSVHEVGREGETLYIVSDFVRGVSLSQWLTAKKPSASESAELAIKIARALHYAHERGIVHRDLKPSNVMIDREGEPHLLDFGLAKREAGELTMTADGQVLGTPAYMAPEQGEGDSHYVDRRADIYAFGVILFELLTGELPFRGIAQMQIHQKVTEDAPSPRKFNQFVPRDLATICSKCLERDPNSRYLSARELADDLERFVKGEPIRARPVSRTERTLRWAKRNPWMATAAGLVAFLAIAGPIAAWRIYAQGRGLALKNEENANLIGRLADDKDRADAEITRLQRVVDWHKGDLKKTPPPGQGEGPHQMLWPVFEGRSESLIRKLREGTFSEEEALYAELALAVISDKALRHEDAIQYYSSCVDRLLRLTERQPARRDYLLGLADCHIQLARLYITHDRKAPARFLSEAQVISQRLEGAKTDLPLKVTQLVVDTYNAALQGDNSGREFFLKAAQLGSLDPKDPTEWYELACQITQRRQILESKLPNIQKNESLRGATTNSIDDSPLPH